VVGQGRWTTVPHPKASGRFPGRRRITI